MFRNPQTTQISPLLMDEEFRKLEQRVMDLELKVQKLEYLRERYNELHRALRKYLVSASKAVSSYDFYYSHYPLANWDSCKRKLERSQTYDEVKDIALKWVEETTEFLEGLHRVFDDQDSAIYGFMGDLGMFDR